jgi:hypothetical protein
MVKLQLARLSLLSLLVLTFSCAQPPTDYTKGRDLAFLLHEWNEQITTVMVGDGFSPLLASRTYAYANIASYEVLAFSDTSMMPIASKLNGLGSITPPNKNVNYCAELAALQAYATVSKQLVYRGQYCDSLIAKHIGFFRDSLQMDEAVIAASVAFGTSAGNTVLAWANSDNYSQTKAKPKYLFSNEKGKWVPTPAEYRSALEPYWHTLRPFTTVDPKTIEDPFTIPYSTEEGSEFYNLVRYVYDKSKNLSDEERLIATYWDDNPDITTFIGHVPMPRRRMSPPAHWMGIAMNTSITEGLTFKQAAQVYAMVSMSMADAIIFCWKEKYSSNLVRPVTYIQEMWEPDWQSLIITPNFPEHSSGHSATSAAAAQALTAYFGDNFKFTDVSAEKNGDTPRTFASFKDAAWEVSLSRVCGGIHYMTGVEAGIRQGEKVGNHVGSLFKKDGK